MKVLTLALLFSLPVSPIVPQKPLRQPTTQITKHSKGGTLVLCGQRTRRLLLRPSDDRAASQWRSATRRHLLPRRQRRSSAKRLTHPHLPVGSSHRDARSDLRRAMALATQQPSIRSFDSGRRTGSHEIAVCVLDGIKRIKRQGV